MKLLTNLITTALVLLPLAGHAQGPSQNASKASEHSVKASGYGLASSAQVASATVAIPIIAVGSVGVASLSVGNALLDAASVTSKATDKCEPLEISDKVITAGPSPQALMNEEDI